MNERIKEIIKKAGGQFDYIGTPHLPGPLVEKFSELMVNEFCRKLEDDGMVEVAIEMKQYFGFDKKSNLPNDFVPDNETWIEP